MDSPERTGLGVRVTSPTPPEWGGLLEHQTALIGDAHVTGQIKVLVFVASSTEGQRAFYACSGWNVQIATELQAAVDALSDLDLAVVVADCPATDPRWRALLGEAQQQRPNARRILRTSVDAAVTPANVAAEALTVLSSIVPGPVSDDALASDSLIHRLVEDTTGLEGLVDAITTSFAID